MLRPLAIALVILLPTKLAAQTASPPIAYVKTEGTAASLYLTRGDGSTPIRVTVTAAKRRICALDLKPGGGEVAYVECGKGVPRTVKIVTFSDAGVATGARTLSGLCEVDTVDYHPTDPALIISEICNAVPRIASVRTDGSGYSVLFSGGSYLNKARWLRDGVSFVYVRAPVDGGALQICRDDCSGANLLATVSGVWSLDVGRQSNVLLFDDGGPIHRLNADTGAIDSSYLSGSDGHYSPSDDAILYETPYSARGTYLKIRRADGGVTTLTGKGDYGAKDWRN